MAKLKGPIIDIDAHGRYVARFWHDGALLIWRFRRDGRKPSPRQIANLGRFVARQLNSDPPHAVDQRTNEA